MAYFFISHDNATYFGVECRKISGTNEKYLDYER